MSVLSQSPGESTLRHGRSMVVGVGVALAASVLAGYAITLVAGFEQLHLAAAIGVLSGSLVIVLARLQRRNDLLSPLGLIAIFYLIAFVGGASYYWSKAGQGGGPESGSYLRESLVIAVIVATAGWLSFLAGHQANLFRGIGRLWPPSSKTLGLGPGRAGLVALLTVGWGARLVTVLDGRYFHVPLPGEEIAATDHSTLVGLVDGLPLLAVAIIGAQAALRSTRPASRRTWVAFWALLALEIAWSLPTGERAAVMAVLFVPLVIWYYGGLRRRKLVLATVAVAVSGFLLFPLLDEYRNVGTSYRQEDVAGSLSIAVRAAAERDFGATVEAGFESIFSRFSDVTAVAAMVYGGRDAVARPPGETLVWSLEALVPRAIYPKKEDPGLFGYEFGATYGFTSPGAQTSIAVTQVGELYLNFGVLGVVAGSFVAGSAYRLLSTLLRGRWHQPAALAVTAVVAWPIIHGQEVILALGLVGLMKQLAIYVLALWLVTRRRPSMWSGISRRGVA